MTDTINLSEMSNETLERKIQNKMEHLKEHDSAEYERCLRYRCETLILSVLQKLG